MTALSTTLARIQFRPGPVFGDRLRRRASQWSVNENEVARRLSALADCGLSTGDHDQVVEIASVLQTTFTDAASVLCTQRLEPDK